MSFAHHKSHSISSPIAQPFPSPVHSPPPTRPVYKARRPSLQNSMSRFKDSLKERIQENVQAVHGHVHRRAHSNSSRANDGAYEQPHPVYISEPKLNGSADSLPSTRLAPLGSGAIVVGTPQEALALSAQKGGYRNSPAAASAPSHLNQYHRQQPATVEEEDLDFEQQSLQSPPLPPLPQSTSPTSPTMQTRGLQQQQQQRGDWPQPRRSAESNASGASQASGSRGLHPVLPDQRSQGSSVKNRRGSPLAQSNQQELPAEELVYQARSPSVDPPRSNPAEYFNAATDEAETTTAPLQFQQRKSGPEAAVRPESHFSSFSEAQPRVESECFAAAPQLPLDLATALPQPPFGMLLMSNLPANMHKSDPGKIIVVLETGETTYKTTLKTLTSRPSHLAKHLTELVSSTGATNGTAQTPLSEDENVNGDAGSVYSQRSGFEDSEDESNYAGFNSLFQDHLTSTGIIKPRKIKRKADSTSMMHVFLDRPGTPYAHIIAYLRAPHLSSHPGGMLPYGARLFPAARHSFATARLESLLDLRDEAAYLGLGDLMRLCDEELAGQVPLTGEEVGRSSVHSTHTLCESTTGSNTKGGKGGESMSVDTSPAMQSVDIPIVLPTHESRAISGNTGNNALKMKTLSTDSHGSNASSSASSKRERRVGHVDLETQKTKMPNASQLRGRAKPPGNYI